MHALARLVLGACMVLVGTQALAEVTTVTFFDPDSPPVGITCGEVWTESGVPLHFESATSENCPAPGCAWSRAGGFPGNVYLTPGRLVADLVALAGSVLSVQADVQVWCGVGCTRLLLYDGSTLVGSATNTTAGTLETLTAHPGGSHVTHAVVESCDGVCFEVRIDRDVTVPNKPTSWGNMKALFE